VANFYALPTLATWGDATYTVGFSSTSGGANNGLMPLTTDDVIFDVNSGPARSITIATGATCKNITTVGANAMNFTGTDLQTNGNVDLTGVTGIATLSLYGTASVTLKVPGVTIGAINVNKGTAATYTLLSDILITTGFNFAGVNTFVTGAFNVTANSITTATNSTLDMGSGTWTLAGSGTVWDATNSTLITGTSTIKVTNTSATEKIFFGAGKVYNNIWNATGPGTGGLNIRGSNTFNNIRCDPGSTLSLTTSATTTTTSFTADGTAAPIVIKSDAVTVPATLSKSGGGIVYVDYCSIKDITASPAATFIARASINVSGNTNWTFIPGNSKFMTFL
jgi:hypothetical protein